MKKLFAGAVIIAAAMLWLYPMIENWRRVPVTLTIVPELTPAELARKQSLERYRGEFELARQDREARRRTAALEAQQREARALEQKLLELRLSQ